MYNLKNKYYIEKNKIIFEELYAVLDIADIYRNYYNFDVVFLVRLSKNSKNSIYLNVTNFSIIEHQSGSKLTFKINGYIETAYLPEKEKEVLLSYLEKNKALNFSLFY